jgi:hypothetical protein
MIKIFGERNTSTNALKLLIERNSGARLAPSVAREIDPGIARRLKWARRLRVPEALRERMIDRVFEGHDCLKAWKHTTTRFDDVTPLAGCHVIFCVRHPASWLLGLHRRPYHIHTSIPADLGAFLDLRWNTVGREGLGRAQTSAMELYNLKMAAYADLQSRLGAVSATCSIVRHEDFAVDQAAVFAALVPFLGSPPKAFRPLERSTKDPSRSRSYYEEYYGNQRWRDEIDAECATRINAEIVWSALRPLGYEPL